MKIRKSHAKQTGENQKVDKPRGSDLEAALRIKPEADLPAVPAQSAGTVTQPPQRDEARAAEPRNTHSQRGPAQAGGRRKDQPSQSSRGKPGPIQHTPTTGRFFYALKVPASVTGPLSEAQRKLKGNWRTTTREQMHVTLCYLPSVPLARVAELKALGARLTGDLGPLDVRLRGTGYFPNEGSPRVWFVRVEAEGLDELAAALRAGVQALGIETEELGFKAHITLARRKGPAPRVPPMTFELGWTAGGATLQRSHLQKTGPVYEQVSTFRFHEGGRLQTGDQPAAPPGESLSERLPHTAHDDANNTSPSSTPFSQAQEPA